MVCIVFEEPYPSMQDRHHLFIQEIYAHRCATGIKSRPFIIFNLCNNRQLLRDNCKWFLHWTYWGQIEYWIRSCTQLFISKHAFVECQSDRLHGHWVSSKNIIYQLWSPCSVWYGQFMKRIISTSTLAVIVGENILWSYHWHWFYL